MLSEVRLLYEGLDDKDARDDTDIEGQDVRSDIIYAKLVELERDWDQKYTLGACLTGVAIESHEK